MKKFILQFFVLGALAPTLLFSAGAVEVQEAFSFATEVPRTPPPLPRRSRRIAALSSPMTTQESQSVLPTPESQYFEQQDCVTPDRPTRTIISITPGSPELCVSEETDIIQSLIKILTKENPTAYKIYINSFSLTDYKLVHELARLYKDKKIEIFVVSNKSCIGHSKRALGILEAAGALVRIYEGPGINHNKTVLWTYIDAEGTQQFSAYSGSANITNRARTNREQGVFTRLSEDDFRILKSEFMDIFNQSKNFHYEKGGDWSTSEPMDKPLSYEGVDLPTTPPQQRITRPASSFTTPTTQSHRLLFNEEIAQPMIDHINKTAAGGSIYISAYTYNWPELTQALIAACEREISVSLIVDKATFSSQAFSPVTFSEAPKKQLDELEKAGVTIKVFDTQEFESHHRKAIAIRDSKRIIVGQGSANFTSHAHTDRDTWWWFFHDVKKFILISSKHTLNPDLISYKNFCEKRAQQGIFSTPLAPTSPLQSPTSRYVRTTRQRNRFLLDQQNAFPYPPDFSDYPLYAPPSAEYESSLLR